MRKIHTACLSIGKQHTSNIGRTLILQQTGYMAKTQDNMNSCYQHTQAAKSYNSTSEKTRHQINHQLLKLDTYFRNLFPQLQPNSIYHRFSTNSALLTSNLPLDDLRFRVMGNSQHSSEPCRYDRQLHSTPICTPNPFLLSSEGPIYLLYHIIIIVDWFYTMAKTQD